MLLCIGASVIKSYLVPGLQEHVMLHNGQEWSVGWVGRTRSPGLLVVFGLLAESGVGHAARPSSTSIVEKRCQRWPESKANLNK